MKKAAQPMASEEESGKAMAAAINDVSGAKASMAASAAAAAAKRRKRWRKSAALAISGNRKAIEKYQRLAA